MLPTPLTREAEALFSEALLAIRRGDRNEAELAVRQAMDQVKEYDKARKDAIYVLNTGRLPQRKTDD